MLTSIHTQTCPAPAVAQPSAPYRNYLFIAPQRDSTPDGPIAEEQIIALARAYANDGYVYVARSEQAQMEDDQFGVRYLPLRERLPAFGLLTAAFVVGDKTLATAAAIEYETADVFLLEPGKNGMRSVSVKQQPVQALKGVHAA